MSPAPSFKPSLARLRLLFGVLALIFLSIGLQKLTAYEADAVAPIAVRSPFLAWAYALLGPRGASALFAAVEIPAGLGLAFGVLRPGHPLARIAAAIAAVTCGVTLSFLATAPGAFVIEQGIPLLSLQVGQLFVKDAVLLSVAVVLATSRERLA